MAVCAFHEKRPGLGAAYAALPVLSAAVLAGVFIVCQAQPCGNLEDAPAFAANTKGGALYGVENRLSAGTLCGSAPVISQQVACDRLRQSLFSYGDWFEFSAPEEVRVQSCAMEYIIDSKGFYQPVYLFEMEGLNSAFVPALA